MITSKVVLKEPVISVMEDLFNFVIGAPYEWET